MGIWETEAPLSVAREQEQRERLQELLDRLQDASGAIVLRDMSVWVDGVEWRFRYVETYR